MKHLDEYRDGAAASRVVAAIARDCRHPWVLMEVCGGQTHSIVRYGLDALLPEGLELVHGPGCPVCVTPLEMIDHQLHSPPPRISVHHDEIPHAVDSILAKAMAKSPDRRYGSCMEFMVLISRALRRD